MRSNAHGFYETGARDVLLIGIMSSDSFKCSVCGGVMRMVTVVADKSGRSKRYKCTCGHIEDLKEEQWRKLESEALDLEGFQEIL